MFSATLSKEIRPVCRKFTQHVSGAASKRTLVSSQATTRLAAPDFCGLRIPSVARFLSFPFARSLAALAALRLIAHRDVLTCLCGFSAR